jgi:hypothetical protein
LDAHRHPSGLQKVHLKWLYFAADLTHKQPAEEYREKGITLDKTKGIEMTR